MPITDADWDAAVKAQGGVTDADWGKAVEANTTNPNKEMQKEIDKMGVVRRGAIGTGAGLYGLYKGVQQLGYEALNAIAPKKPLGLTDLVLGRTKPKGRFEDDIQRVTREGKEALGQFEHLRSQSKAARIGEFVGQALPAIPLALTGAGGAVASGAALGLTQFVPEEDEQARARQRIQNTAIGAVGGGLGYGAAKVVGKVAKTAYAAAKNSIPAASQALINTAEKHGINLPYQDVVQRKAPVAIGLGRALERSPGSGMVPYRLAQQDQTFDAAKKFLVGFDDGFERTEGGWPAVARKELEKASEAAKAHGDSLYDEVNRLSSPEARLQGLVDELPAGNPRKPTALELVKLALNALPHLVGKNQGESIYPRKTLETLAKLIEEQNSAKMPNKPLLAKLEEAAKKFAADDADNSFANLRQYSQDLGAIIRDESVGKNALVGSRGIRPLVRLQRAVDGDMDLWAEQRGGRVKEAYDTARQYWKNNVVPYRKAVLTKIAEEDDPDKIYGLFQSATADKHGSPTTLYNMLTPRGRAAVEYGMIKDAFLAGKNAEGSTFSPAKFATFLEDRQKATGIFFDEQRRAEVEGFRNLMRHVQDSAQFAAVPYNGSRLTFELLLGASGPTLYAMGHPGVAAAVMGSAALTWGTSRFLTKLFTSKGGRNFLLAARNTEPGTKMEGLIQEYMTKYHPNLGSRAGTVIGAQAGANFSREGEVQPTEYLPQKKESLDVPPAAIPQGAFYKDNETGEVVWSPDGSEPQ